MANKTVAKRQKLSFRVEPSQKALKPRNPVALPARQGQKRTLKKILGESEH